MIQELTTAEFSHVTADVFHRIFNDPFDYNFPFTSQLPRRAILYPIWVDALEERQLLAIKTAATQIHDESSFLSYLDLSDGVHWRISVDQLEACYDAWTLGLENVLFSAGGRWAVLQSRDEHAILGGDDEFMKRFRSAYPRLDQDLLRLVKDMGPRPSWFPGAAEGTARLLEYVYGVDGGELLESLASGG